MDIGCIFLTIEKAIVKRFKTCLTARYITIVPVA